MSEITETTDAGATPDAPEATPPAAPEQPTATPQGAPAQAWYNGLYDGEGRLNKEAFNALPEHLKPLKPTLERVNTVEDIFTKLHHLNSAVGKKGLLPLAEGADEKARAEWDAQWRQMGGIPDKPEGYGKLKPEQLPEGVDWDEGLEARFIELAHKHGARPELAKELAAMHVQMTAEAVAANKAAADNYAKENLAALKKEFGEQTQGLLDDAASAARRLGVDPANPVFSSPDVVKAFARVNGMIKESKLVGADDKGDLGGDARAQVAEYGRKASEAYRNRDMDAYNRYSRLQVEAAQRVK